MSYRLLWDDRKQAVAKIDEMTGERPVFTRFPRNAYVIRGIALESDNSVTVEDGADMELLRQLISVGLVEAPQEAHDAPVDEEAEASGETVAQEEEAQEAPTVEETVSDDGEDEQEEAEEAESTAEPDEDDEEDEPYADLITNPQPIRPVISFPISQHRAESICNLVFTLFSRGKLLSKATGGQFSASADLIETLQTESLIRVEDVLEAISEAGEGAVAGISFADGKVSFDGFPATASQETIQAWTALATAINKTAIKQNHVRAKEVDDANEKFAFRTWLTRLGMNGSELKAERNILYRNLSGHTAFRTAADAEKWTKRQNAKRQALKEMKAAAGAATERENTGDSVSDAEYDQEAAEESAASLGVR